VVITSTLFDHGPEWRAFDEEQREKRTRVGAPLTWTIHDKGLSTIIDWHDRDVYGRKLKPDQKARVYRLRKWHRRSKVSGATERNLAFALSELTKVAYKLNLPKNVLETASVIYRKVVRKRLIRGRSIQGVAAASIYMACRQCNIIRTLEEVAAAAHISKKEGGRNYRFLLRKLETRVPPVDPTSYISKFVNQLTLSGETESIAMQILGQAMELRLTSGRGPAGIAAAATYIASTLTDERRTQGEIAKGAHVTEVTIRNRYKELTQKLNIELDM
jgi:transcription initiation factor TFIIB